MKKTVTVMLAVAFGAFIAQAQTTSDNIVGYTKTSHSGGFSISSVQFDVSGDETPTSVYGDQLPSGSKVYSWDGSSYSIASYAPAFVPGQGLVTKWSAEPVLSAGTAHWVETTSSVEAIQAGEVSGEASITTSIPAGFSLVSYPYPVARTVSELGLSPASGDKIYLWDGSGYTIISYAPAFVPGQGLVTQWSNGDAAVAVGQGFWYETATPQTWSVNKPF